MGSEAFTEPAVWETLTYSKGVTLQKARSWKAASFKPQGVEIVSKKRDDGSGKAMASNPCTHCSRHLCGEASGPGDGCQIVPLWS